MNDPVLALADVDWVRSDGARQAVLAGPERIPGFAMTLVRLELDPEAELEAPAGERERLLHVIAGDGYAEAGGERLALAPESVLWLESGEACRLRAGDGGLALLAVRSEPGAAQDSPSVG